MTVVQCSLFVACRASQMFSQMLDQNSEFFACFFLSSAHFPFPLLVRFPCHLSIWLFSIPSVNSTYIQFSTLSKLSSLSVHLSFTFTLGFFINFSTQLTFCATVSALSVYRLDYGSSEPYPGSSSPHYLMPFGLFVRKSWLRNPQRLVLSPFHHTSLSWLCTVSVGIHVLVKNVQTCHLMWPPATVTSRGQCVNGTNFFDQTPPARSRRPYHVKKLDTAVSKSASTDEQDVKSQQNSYRYQLRQLHCLTSCELWQEKFCVWTVFELFSWTYVHKFVCTNVVCKLRDNLQFGPHSSLALVILVEIKSSHHCAKFFGPQSLWVWASKLPRYHTAYE